MRRSLWRWTSGKHGCGCFHCLVFLCLPNIVCISLF
jgi:hypothetical protein